MGPLHPVMLRGQAARALPTIVRVCALAILVRNWRPEANEACDNLCALRRVDRLETQLVHLAAIYRKEPCADVDTIASALSTMLKVPVSIDHATSLVKNSVLKGLFAGEFVTQAVVGTDMAWPHAKVVTRPWAGYEERGALHGDPIMVTADDGTLVLFVGAPTLTYRTSDDGVDWSASQPIEFAHGEVAPPAYYPQACKLGDAWYLTSWQHGDGVYLWRATSFPARWEAVGKLTDAKPMHPTLFETSDGHAMLLVGDATGGSLRAFISPLAQLHSTPWVEHPQSPVVQGLDRIAPAGSLFTDADGLLWRPAQDIRIVYGRCVRAWRVDKISSTEYVEEPDLSKAVFLGGATGVGHDAIAGHLVSSTRKADGSVIGMVDGLSLEAILSILK